MEAIGMSLFLTKDELSDLLSQYPGWCQSNLKNQAIVYAWNRTHDGLEFWFTETAQAMIAFKVLVGIVEHMAKKG